MQLEERVVDDVLARLRRIEGQVGGLIRMVESGRECREVVRQVNEHLPPDLHAVLDGAYAALVGG